MSKGREIEKEHGKLNLWNGDSSRLHVRKAQYKYVFRLKRYSVAHTSHSQLWMGLGYAVVSSNFVEFMRAHPLIRSNFDDCGALETYKPPNESKKDYRP